MLGKLIRDLRSISRAGGTWGTCYITSYPELKMIHSMHKIRGKTGFFAIKVDLKKAYGRLNWDFIRDVLIELNFPSHLITIIMHCVTSVRTNVLWNGVRTDFFSAERGIRQGDPLPPYLFVLCMDKLSHLIAEAVEDGSWTPLRAGRRGPQIAHLMFVDDILLFGKASVRQMDKVKDVLHKFCLYSGQAVSFEKSNILLSKNTFSFGKYLGVLLTGKVPGYQDFHYLIDKVKAKLSGWKAKELSFVGRVMLSKAIIQAIPVYPMMTTLIPVGALMKSNVSKGTSFGETLMSSERSI